PVAFLFQEGTDDDVVPSGELEQAGKDGDTEQAVDDAFALGDVEPRVGHKALHEIDEDGIQNERPADDLNRKGKVAGPRGGPGEGNEQGHQQDYEPIPGASEAVHRRRRPWYHVSESLLRAIAGLIIGLPLIFAMSN